MTLWPEGAALNSARCSRKTSSSRSSIQMIFIITTCLAMAPMLALISAVCDDASLFHQSVVTDQVSLLVPWLDTATKKLLAPPESYHPREAGEDPLPPPSKPPTDTKSQALWTYLTHREEPPTVLVALGLLNDTRPLPDDHIPTTRQWQTSTILPFLGHVGLERLTCSDGDFVRLIVNEDPMPIPDCQNGPGRTCPLKSFKALIEKRRSIFDDFQEGCKKENKGS